MNVNEKFADAVSQFDKNFDMDWWDDLKDLPLSNEDKLDIIQGIEESLNTGIYYAGFMPIIDYPMYEGANV